MSLLNYAVFTSYDFIAQYYEHLSSNLVLLSHIVECGQYLPEQDTIKMFPACKSIGWTVQTVARRFLPQLPADTTNYINYRQTGSARVSSPPLSIFAQSCRALLARRTTSLGCRHNHPRVAFHVIEIVPNCLYKYELLLGCVTYLTEEMNLIIKSEMATSH